MRARCCVLTIVLLVPAAAQAQTSTLDGIAALTRGDYASAARILRPLAENSPRPDPLALFVMATLYHSGRGVAMNSVRACGLYIRAGIQENPLMAQSLALAHTIHHDVPLLLEECVAASRRPWIDPPPASFALAKDHWVRIDSEGFVVGYNGIQKTAAMPLGGVGWMYLPTRHTQLDVSRPVSTRRHFIEFFIWMPPGAGQAAWALVWVPFEIVGAETRPVPARGILATAVDRPPSSFAVDEVLGFRVNADGEAEWAVRGPNPRGGVIPFTDPR